MYISEGHKQFHLKNLISQKWGYFQMCKFYCMHYSLPNLPLFLKRIVEIPKWEIQLHLNQPRVIVAGCLQKKNSKANQKFLYRLQFIRHWVQYVFFRLFLFPKHTLPHWRLVWIKNVCMLAEMFNILKASIKNVWVLAGICNILKLQIKAAFPFTPSGPLDTFPSASEEGLSQQYFSSPW